MHYTLSQIAQITNGKLLGNPETSVTAISIDSRSFSAGENLLFVAIVGKNHDGHRFVSELKNRKVQNFLVQHLDDRTSDNANYIIVENTKVALQQIAAYHRSQYSIPTVGITGSNGKTIVKEWLNQLLAPHFSIVRSPKSYNSQVGVPLSVLQTEQNHELAIFEAGISEKNEMQNLEQILKPTIGIFTNIGEAHQENFENKQQKAKEKLKLFPHSEYLIFSEDYAEITHAIQEISDFNPQLITWSSTSDGNVKIIKKEQKSEISIDFEERQFHFSIPFTDDASTENAIHCFFALMAIEKTSDKTCFIADDFLNLQPVGMRLEFVHGINGCTLINDSYNSDLNSLKIALESLTQQNQHKRRSVILSDIYQSGKSEERLYKEVATMLAESKIDQLYAIGNHIVSFRNYFAPQSRFYNSTEAFLKYLQTSDFQKEAILIKGARNFHFEDISRALAQKNHHTVLEINLDNLQHNLDYFRSLLKKETKIMAMVKAFSYGSGSYEIANWLQHQRIDYLGVAYADEGVELRKAGITLPIMVMNVDVHNFDQIIDFGLEPEVYSERIFKELATRTNSFAPKSLPIHIKLDTGMRRLGFDSNQIYSLLELLKTAPQFKVMSVFSHLVGTDSNALDGFTSEQIHSFELMSKQIENHLSYPFLRHTLNSAGIERHTQAQFDMVRLGIGLYGISQNKRPKTLPISTLKTFISQIKHIKKGESVGYSRNWIAERDSIIGTLPIGYADCINRRLGNGNGYVNIRGQKALFVGNICMDMCMVDLTDVNAEEGDEVIIFGEWPTIIDIAGQLGTIPYEVLTSVSSRVKRVYFQGE